MEWNEVSLEWAGLFVLVSINKVSVCWETLRHLSRVLCNISVIEVTRVLLVSVYRKYLIVAHENLQMNWFNLHRDRTWLSIYSHPNAHNTITPPVFFSCFYEYPLHVGCTMHNEECHLLLSLFVVSNFKVGDNLGCCDDFFLRSRVRRYHGSYGGDKHRLCTWHLMRGWHWPY